MKPKSPVAHMATAAPMPCLDRTLHDLKSEFSKNEVLHKVRGKQAGLRPL